MISTILVGLGLVTQAGLTAYCIYLFQKLKAHWLPITCFLILLTIVIFFLVPLARDSRKLAPEWRIVTMLSLVGCLFLAYTRWQIGKKELTPEPSPQVVKQKTCYYKYQAR